MLICLEKKERCLKTKICMLVRNNCLYDNRVLKEAAALSNHGYDVNILAVKDESTPEYEIINNITFHRVPKTPILLTKVRDKYISKYDRISQSYIFRSNKYQDLYINLVERWRLKKHIRLRLVFAKNVYLISKIIRKMLVIMRLEYEKFVYLIKRRLIKSTRPIYGLYDFHFNSIEKLLEISADVYHAHDLNTLLTAYIASKKTGAKLVYDSHELEIHRNYVNVIWFERFTWRVLEKYLIRKCNAVITVSDGIAEHIAKYYKIPTPMVLLNCPNYYEPIKCTELKKRFNNKKILLYVGGMTFNRGLEQTIEAMQYVKSNAIFVAIGPKVADMVIRLEELINKYGLKEKVFLLDPVPVSEIKEYTSGADIGIIPGLNVCLSYDLSLPSKFFEYVFAELPVIVGQLSELSRLVKKYKIGMVVDQTNPRDIAEKIDIIIENPQEFSNKESFKMIRDNMCWEKEQEKLKVLYKKIFQKDSLKLGGKEVESV